MAWKPADGVSVSFYLGFFTVYLNNGSKLTKDRAMLNVVPVTVSNILLAINLGPFNRYFIQHNKGICLPRPFMLL